MSLAKCILLKVWGMLLEVKIHQKTIKKTEWILEGIFDGFWLHFEAHFGGKMLQQSMQ